MMATTVHVTEPGRQSGERSHILARLEHLRQTRLKDLQTSEAVEEVVLDMLTICTISLPVAVILGFLAFLVGTDLFLVTVSWALFTMMFYAGLLVVLAAIELKIRDREGVLSIVEDLLDDGEEVAPVVVLEGK